MASRLENLNREIEALKPAATKWAELGLDLTAKGLTGVQQQLRDRAELYCELVATRTRLEA